MILREGVCRRHFFPNAQQGFPFHSGGLGVEGVFARRCATICNRSQPSAGDHVRPVWPCLWRVLQQWSLWRFHRSRSLVSRGRRGTSWHSDVLSHVSKVVLCGRRNTFATFPEDEFQFSWQAQHFGDLHRHFAWQGQHFRRCVFFANRIVRAAWSGDNVQIPWQAWHFVICAENWRKLRTKHRFWGCKFWCSLRKLVGKRRFWSYKVMKIGRSLARNALFDAPTCLSLEFSGFPLASPCLWGKLQHRSFS